MSDYQKLNKRRGQALTISDVGTIETQYDAAKREAEAGRWNISAGSVAYSSLSGKPTLGDAASKNVGVGTGDVAAGNHTHSYSSLSEKPTLGSAAAKNVGTGSQDVSAGDHSHAGYVTANNAITGATKAKVTFDAKGLVTGGADLIASDIPTIDYSALSGKPTLGAAAARSKAPFSVGAVANVRVACLRKVRRLARPGTVIFTAGQGSCLTNSAQ